MCDQNLDCSVSGAKRIYSSSTEESDISFGDVSENLSRKPERKRQHLTEVSEGTEINMDIQSALVRIEKQLAKMPTKKDLDDLPTKEDFKNIKKEIQTLTSNFMETVGVLEGRLFDLETAKDRQDQEIKQLKKNNEKLTNTLKQQESKLKELEKDQNELEQYSRRTHVRVFKIPEHDRETSDDCTRKVCSVFTDKVGVAVYPTDIKVAHRTGRCSGERARPILVRFFDRKKRDQVLFNWRKLKNKGISIGEDLTAANYRLLKVATDHHATMSAWSSGGKITAKTKNGVVVKINIHTDLDEAFRRAMSPADVSVEEEK